MRLDVALVVAHDPAVAERVGDHAGQDAHRPLGRLVLLGERPQALARAAAGCPRYATIDRARAAVRGSASMATRTAWPVPSWVSWTASTASGTSSLDVRPDLLALVADHGDDPLRLHGLHGAAARGRSCCARRWGAAPSSSWTSSGCRRRRRGRSRSGCRARSVSRRARPRSAISSPGRSRTYVASPDSKSGGPCRQTNRGMWRQAWAPGVRGGGDLHEISPGSSLDSPRRGVPDAATSTVVTADGERRDRHVITTAGLSKHYGQVHALTDLTSMSARA